MVVLKARRVGQPNVQRRRDSARKSKYRPSGRDEESEAMKDAGRALENAGWEAFNRKYNISLTIKLGMNMRRLRWSV